MEPRESAGGVIKGPDGRIVLVEQHGNSWSFPKGGLEEGESALEAAQREIREETGIDELEYLADLGSYSRPSISRDGTSENLDWGNRKRTLFLFRTKQTVFKLNHDEEITDARWATIDEALALLTHPKDREFLASVRAKIEVC